MNWKAHERAVAKKFGGKRISRGSDFSVRSGDIDHPTLSIECKYRKNIPKLIVEALKQAKGYSPDKIPVAAIKQRQMEGFVVCLWIDDFLKLTQKP